MNISNRVDVIVAETSGALVEAPYDDPTVEAVDVAPDPHRRFIVLAPTKQAGQEHAESLSIEPVAIVTPRSPYGARGVVADEIVEAEGLTAEERDALTVEVALALATGGAE